MGRHWGTLLDLLFFIWKSTVSFHKIYCCRCIICWYQIWPKQCGSHMFFFLTEKLFLQAPSMQNICSSWSAHHKLFYSKSTLRNHLPKEVLYTAEELFRQILNSEVRQSQMSCNTFRLFRHPVILNQLMLLSVLNCFVFTSACFFV
jgi:hypothetical protein